MKNHEELESFFSEFMVGDFNDCEDVFLEWLSKSENEQKLISSLEKIRGEAQSKIALTIKMVDDGLNDDDVWEKYSDYIHNQLNEILNALGGPSGPYD
jgi:hypothetical protein